MREAVLKFWANVMSAPLEERSRVMGKLKEPFLNEFFEWLATTDPKKRVLALDYDGTLAPLHVDPLRAYPYPGVVERLEDISEISRFVIVTGRKVVEIPPLLCLRRPFEICGVHGWERQSQNGTFTQTPVPRTKRRALDQVESWMGKAEEMGAWYERKHASVVLHWRSLMEAGDHETIAVITAYIDKLWLDLNRRDILSRYPTDGGLEIRAKGWDKGKVIAALMHKAEAGAFLGDDTTDEDAFRAIKYNDMLRSSVLSVLVHPEWKRASDAVAHLRPPEELLNFIDRWIEVCRRSYVSRLVSVPLQFKLQA